MYCENCGNKLPDGDAFCSNCGERVEPETAGKETPEAHDQPPANNQPQAYKRPPAADAQQPRPLKSMRWLIITAAAVAFAGLCVGAYFLFFAGRQPKEMGMESMPAQATANPTNQVAVDFAATRDVADLIGVWEGTLTYTEISGDWKDFGYPVSEAFSQSFMLIITEDRPELGWRGAILRINGKDAAVLSAGFEGRFLEIRGEWQSCDVSISVEYDKERGGFKGAGEYIHSEKHASFDFFMALTDESTGDSVKTTPVASHSGTAEMVSAQTIIVKMAYDSGEGTYTGEVENSVPNGQGRFEMVKSDNGKAWSYEGQWENGEITGEGVMIQGSLVFKGSFSSGLLNGSCEITDGGVLRYKGMCRNGMLHGAGTLYTSSGKLLFKGSFENDMLVESAAAREKRGEAFKPECEDMDELLYDGCMAEDNTFGYPVVVWGFPIAMGEQTANGTVVIGHMGENSTPVCLVYRYGVDEAKMTKDDWINAWGVVVGTYEYKDADGLTVTCPMVEVIYWNNDQEGL